MSAEYERDEEACPDCGQFISEQHKRCCKTCNSRCSLKYGCGSADCESEPAPEGMYLNDSGGYQYPSEAF